MRITIATPVRPGVSSGNDITAARWARRLGELGHDATVVPLEPVDGEGYDPASTDDVGDDADVLVVLHARRCARAVAASRHVCPERPVIVGLAGTDLYADLPHDPDASASVRAADALVVLQPNGVERLRSIDAGLAAKATVVHQSVEPPLPVRRRSGEAFRVVVLAHLRDVKDPLLAARAARRLPAESRVVIVHAGAAHDDEWAAAAAHEARTNHRYRWLGEVDRASALELLASADVLACTSRLEGGANVVTEAVALGIPVIGTAIDGTTGLLGEDHPDLVAVGDADALAVVMTRLASDEAAYADAEERVVRLRHLTEPAAERAAWAEVLDRVARR